MGKSWSDDGEKPGSPTSRDILVRWLRTPGNYKRWQSEAKTPLIQEIVAEIKKLEAAKRSPSAVRRKIMKLEQQFEAAATWLGSQGHLVAYADDKVSEAVKQAVLQRCPLYRELTPVFQATRNEDGEDRNEVGAASTEQTAEEELKPAELLAAKGKRKGSPGTLEENGTLKKRGEHEAAKTQTLMDQADPLIAAKLTEELRSSPLSERSLVLAEYQRGSESRWHEYCAVQDTPCLGETGEKRPQQLLQSELERIDAMAKLQLEEEQKRQEMYTRSAAMLMRHKLRSAGVSEEEVATMTPK